MTGRLGTKCDGDFVFNLADNFFVTLSYTDPRQHKPWSIEILNNSTKTQYLPQRLRIVGTNYRRDCFKFSLLFVVPTSVYNATIL
jgi:hypothetical protein